MATFTIAHTLSFSFGFCKATTRGQMSQAMARERSLAGRNQTVNFDGSPSNSAAVVAKDIWRRWKLNLLRIGTRETTAVLFLDDDEKLRINWDSTTHEPRKLRAGIGLSSAGATATILADELRLTELER
jgi:hypothetical protein